MGDIPTSGYFEQQAYVPVRCATLQIGACPRPGADPSSAYIQYRKPTIKDWALYSVSTSAGGRPWILPKFASPVLK
ncbi:hypothetical protein SAMN04490188_4570 [Pseudomonas kilonensis]|uniref:Uncharacterized protein n=1 Tax=Pseudomonas kilonensis TaxID=132476 RepID=A0ABY0ZF33_9PSED|nr:hypothetical protein SAMN04490188_4570 [Pseudomonas kilonensis]